MKIINVPNVQAALPAGLEHLDHCGIKRDGRIVSPVPVTTHYRNPRQRVIFWPERDANPFVHLLGSLLTLARHTPLNELLSSIEMFKADDTPCGLQMCDVLGRITLVYFCLVDSQLNMTVCNYSNDMITETYGSDAVYFSILQEFIAAGVGVGVGSYWQVSNNFYVYDNDDLKRVKSLVGITPILDPYNTHGVTPFPLVSTPIEQWLQDLNMFLDEGPVIGLRDPFFRRVVVPMYMAHRAYKEKEGPEKYLVPLEILQQCQATDWQMAAREWIQRRYDEYTN